MTHPDNLPPRLMLELTCRCNYACPYCYCLWHEFPQLKQNVLHTAQWKTVIEEAAARGVGSFLFTGGEALLHPGAQQLLDFTRKRLPEGEITLFTNGSRMTEELLRWCRRRRIALATSLQGLRTYARMTGTRRSCRRALELLRSAAQLKWPFAVSVTVTQENMPELPDLLMAATLFGAASMQVGAVMPEGRGRRHPELTLSREEWETLKAQLRKRDYGIPCRFCDEMICECRPQPAEYLTRFANPHRSLCRAGEQFGVISPNGTFRKCLHAF